ncbi:MAG: hypothetical protein CMM50_07705 [Rhodospirillaceae bacterium]|nr:hypothetical protein [Rhodospirillaceae bacterium]
MPRSKRPGVYLRVLLSGGVMIGPGKADLLQAIDRFGSISAAGRHLGMSYRRAWLLVDELNGSFQKPLVSAVPGGKGGGGAALTPMGQDILKRYRHMQATADAKLAAELAELDSLLKPGLAAEDSSTKDGPSAGG